MPGTGSPARIHKLPQALANQIAAGEVIERPASVVKELLENSLDAGATAIDIDVHKGGVQLIRVLDNGYGIHPDDLSLALESHATSKLLHQADLYRIGSLGFRGEALSSIASIAQFKLTSRRAGIDQAWSLSVDPVSGDSVHAPAAHPVGTSVEVKNLFHTTPARRKFLRTERTEFLHILEMVKRLVLSRYEVGIRLCHNAKQVLSCRASAGDTHARVTSIMGRAFRRQAMELDFTVDGMRLWGWLGGAGLSRSQTDRQYFYVNGRVVRDKRLNHAIRLAFEDEIAAGRHASYLLYLEMDAALTDVNVHPTKHEVRFKEARNVHDFIYASVCNSLNEGKHSFQGVGEPQQLEDVPEHPGSVDHTSSAGTGRNFRETSLVYAASAGRTGTAHSVSEKPRLGWPIASLCGRFILAERENTLLLVDGQAARRCIVRTRMQSARRGESVRQRPLLVPVSLTVSEVEGGCVEQHASLLSTYGLILQRISPTSVMVRSIPALLPDADIQALIRDVLGVLENGSGTDESLQDALIAVMEQHACDAAGECMSLAEMQELLRSLAGTGIDVNSRDCSGIWRSLDIHNLEALVKS
ncbi:MAG: DNA mismatch repair endonuclease MutL [Gammaproteobacteria bacterium]